MQRLFIPRSLFQLSVQAASPCRFPRNLPRRLASAASSAERVAIGRAIEDDYAKIRSTYSLIHLRFSQAVC